MVGTKKGGESLARAVLCASALLVLVQSAPAGEVPSPAGATRAPFARTAYHQGKEIRFTPATVRRGRVLAVGGLVIGPLDADGHPRDRRPNLYIVSPGSELHGNGQDLDFNLIVSGVPRTEEPVEWDVYWAVVLDPALQADITGENQLLLAAQDAFAPGDLFDFADIPGQDLLREYLHIDSLAGLDSYRRPGGALPRVIIVPAHFVVRASAVDPDNPPPPGRISRAFSHLSRHKNALGQKTAPVESVKK